MTELTARLPFRVALWLPAKRLADRVDTLDGRLTLCSPSGEGTTVTAEFSCAS